MKRYYRTKEDREGFLEKISEYSDEIVSYQMDWEDGPMLAYSVSSPKNILFRNFYLKLSQDENAVLKVINYLIAWDIILLTMSTFLFFVSLGWFVYEGFAN